MQPLRDIPPVLEQTQAFALHRVLSILSDRCYHFFFFFFSSRVVGHIIYGPYGNTMKHARFGQNNRSSGQYVTLRGNNAYTTQQREKMSLKNN